MAEARALLAELLDSFADDPDGFMKRMKALKRRVKKKMRDFEKNATVQKESARLFARLAAKKLRRHV